ncbi:MAG: hypothetical protein FWC02_01670 [Firmicutes bacterium]|nr:hypothetical protein [Bacillota bacterium]
MSFTQRSQFNNPSTPNREGVFDENSTLTSSDMNRIVDNTIDLDERVSAMLNRIYPIGAIYMSISNVNPSEWLSGTTWARWGQGRVPVGVDENDTDFNTTQRTGGNKNAVVVNHTHTVNENGIHTHTAASGGSHTHGDATGAAGAHSHTTTSNGSHAHSLFGSNATPNSIRGASLNMRSQTAHGSNPHMTSNGAHTHTAQQGSTAATGGNHTHTITSSGGHVHTIDSQGAHTHTTLNPTGGVAATSRNLQPYITCFMWLRTK